MLKVVEINCETGEVIEREMTKKEIDQQKIDKAKSDLFIEESSLINDKRKSILEKLGISEDEAKLLLS